MPDYIDEAWEYYVPDDELTEPSKQGARTVKADDLFDRRQQAAGFRISTLAHLHDNLCERDDNRDACDGEGRAVCLHCGVLFPRVPGRGGVSNYCGRACRKNGLRDEKRKQIFRRLYEAGATMSSIETALCAAEVTLRKWRSELGLAKRPVGHPRKRTA